MGTHEPELTAPTPLCRADGRRLNPAAVGWSPRPLIEPNLRGAWGRNKRWDYHAVLSGEVAVSLVYADIDYLGIVAVWWVHLPTGLTGGREVSVPLARGVTLPDRYGSAPLTFRHHHLGVEAVTDAQGTDLTARWREPDGTLGRLDARMALPPGHGSVDVVVPWSDRRFQYTSKHQARPVRGRLEVADRIWQLGQQPGDPAWGVLDIGRGRWPYRTVWNWGGGAGVARDGRVVGLQLGGRWTEGTGVTENGVIVDGRVHKVGEELTWTYDWDQPLAPWRVRSPGGDLDLVLAPRHDRHARTEALLLGTEVHQVFGTWSGRVPGPGGDLIEVVDALGFAEESRSRW